MKLFAYKNGYISGTISIIPDETIVEHLMDEAGCYQAYLQADRMKNFMIEIHMNLNSDHKETSISFYSNTKEISNISVSATLKEVMPDDFPEGVPDIDKYVDENGDSWMYCEWLLNDKVIAHAISDGKNDDNGTDDTFKVPYSNTAAGARFQMGGNLKVSKWERVDHIVWE